MDIETNILSEMSQWERGETENSLTNLWDIRKIKQYANNIQRLRIGPEGPAHVMKLITMSQNTIYNDKYYDNDHKREKQETGKGWRWR